MKHWYHLYHFVFQDGTETDALTNELSRPWKYGYRPKTWLVGAIEKWAAENGVTYKRLYTPNTVTLRKRWNLDRFKGFDTNVWMKTAPDFSISKEEGFVIPSHDVNSDGWLFLFPDKKVDSWR